MLQVRKRDGRIVEWDNKCIVNAISSCFIETKGEANCNITNSIAKEIRAKLQHRKIVDIEEVQDLVENELIYNSFCEEVKAYIKYREKRKRDRERDSQIFKEMKKVFEQKSEQMRDNANKSGDKIYSFRAMVSDVACDTFADIDVVPPHLLEKHKKSIYIHDKSYLAIPFFNCMLVNWRDMLENGFHMNGALISQPNRLSSAVAVLCQIIAHTSSNSYGGNTIANLDVGLSKYVEKSYQEFLKEGEKWKVLNVKAYANEKIRKEVYSAMESMEYELNTLLNAKSEPPFLSITFGLGTGKWERLIQEAYLETRYKGFANDVTPTFPKLGFFAKEGLNLNPEDKNYDMFQLAVKCQSRRMYPDILSVDKLIENTGDVKSPMGCRSFLGSYLDENGNYVTDGRFNISVCSINLTRLGLQATGEESFYKKLDEALEDATEVVMLRYNILKEVKAKQSPILYTEGAIARLNPEDTIEPLLKNGYATISIGYVGLHNCMMALYGKSYFESPELMKKGKAILQYLRDFCDKKKKETGLGFSLYGTPAETLATKFCKEDQKDFGIFEGINDLGYYENSYHYPSVKDITPFDKIDFEADFQKISSGGAISYVQFGNMENNLEALEEVVRYACKKLHYFGVNTRPDRCLKCGYKGVINPKTVTENDYVCPNCGNTDRLLMSIIIRLCGYLGDLALRPTIDNKMKEMHTRVVHIGAGN